MLIAQTTNDNPFENEPIGLTYKLYIPKYYQVQNYNELSQPQFNGFWAQDIDKKISGPYDGEINGKKYIYYILKKKLLLPQQTGNLTIYPLTLSIDILKPVIKNFGWARIRDYESKRIKLSSGKKIIKVKPLPKQSPIDFSGAVGNFDLNVTVDNNQVETGNPVNIKIAVSGTGNLKLFNLPKLKAPNGIEIYDPKHTENIKTTFLGNKGVVSDEYIIIPDKSGKFIIPGIRFSFFNPKTKKYETKISDDIIIFAKGNNNYTQNSLTNTEEDNFTDSGVDFRFIKEKTKFIHKKNKYFYQSKLFYLLFFLPFILALILFIYKKYLDNKTFDINIEKAKKRKSLAQKLLNNAKNSINDKENFYAALEKALHNFLKAKLYIDTSDLTKDNIAKLLLEHNVDNKLVQELKNVLTSCETARYAPVSSGEINKDLEKTEQLINKLDKVIK